MGVKFYEVAEDVSKAFADATDEETGEINIEKLHGQIASFHEKGVAVIAHRENLKLEAEALAAFIARKQKQLKTIENKVAGVDEYIESCMRTAGMSEVKAIDGSFRAKIYPNRDYSAEVYDMNQVPVEYIKVVPESKKPDLAQIRKDLKDGVVIPGAKLNWKDRFEIRS